MQNKEHKNCVFGVINKIKETHQSYREYPLFRDGDVHFIDVVAFPHKDKTHLKPLAVECECGSSKLQQQSNRLDLFEFRKIYSDGEIFQVNNSNQIDWRKLIKQRT